MLRDVRAATRSERLYEGVYRSNWWNFELEFRGRQYFEFDYPKSLPDDFSCYGVCDSPEQLMEKLPNTVKSGPKFYVVSMVRLRKDEQEEGGWRWHKWGEYIGTQNPQCEYLKDEPDIEEVWTYHVYELRDND